MRRPRPYSRGSLHPRVLRATGTAWHRWGPPVLQTRIARSSTFFQGISPDFVALLPTPGTRHGQGRFECLALAPSALPGSPGSGNFDTNVMYVTGTITAVQINGSVAVLTGSATVTGLGAGSNVPFTATAERGGPGTTFVLTI